jgi:mono/diheme cytochrome c family protein
MDMNGSASVSFIAFTVLMLTGASSLSQTGRDLGKIEYERSCASCHGISGTGDGAMRAHLVKPPTNLTLLSLRNGGVFPSQRVWETIEGSASVGMGPHGSREMPVWGQIYGRHLTQPSADWYAAQQIGTLIYYLARIQQ